jgi:Flp pilus assembly pilin Flp
MLRDEDGQDAIEWLLATGAVAVVVAAALLIGFGFGNFQGIVPRVLDRPAHCNTIDPLGGGSCISEDASP